MGPCTPADTHVGRGGSHHRLPDPRPAGWSLCAQGLASLSSLFPRTLTQLHSRSHASLWPLSFLPSLQLLSCQAISKPSPIIHPGGASMADMSSSVAREARVTMPGPSPGGPPLRHIRLGCPDTPRFSFNT